MQALINARENAARDSGQRAAAKQVGELIRCSYCGHMSVVVIAYRCTWRRCRRHAMHTAIICGWCARVADWGAEHVTTTAKMTALTSFAGRVAMH